jgi:hypothetical protein
MAKEIGDEARKKSAGDSFTSAIERVVEHEVRGEREVSER